MARYFVLFLLAALPLAGETATTGKGRLGAAPDSRPAPIATRGNTTRSPHDRRRAPELDPKRKVNEQDCTKPIDLNNGGNLLCK
jgi:hypothetical protein